MGSNMRIYLIPLCLLVCASTFLTEVHAQTTTDLTNLYVFGKDLSSRNKGNFGKPQELFKDPLIGNIAPVPPDLADIINSQNSGSATTSSTQSEPTSFGHSFVPNNPIDNFVILNSADAFTNLGVSLTTLGYAKYAMMNQDPAGAQAVADASNFGLLFAKNIEDAGNNRMREFEDAGSSGEVGKMGYINCQRKVLEQNGTGADPKTMNIAMVACLKGLDLAGQLTGTGTGGGSFGRSATSGSPFVARSGVTTRAASTGPVDDVMVQCGFPASGGTSGFTCDSGGGTPTGTGTALTSVKLSYLLYPDVTGSGASSRTQIRSDYQKYFGDVCYVCQKGGTDEFGNTIGNTETRWVPSKKAVASAVPMKQRFQEVNEAVYNALLEIAHTKCLADNAETQFNYDTSNTVEGIFHIKSGGASGTTTVEPTWQAGNFWRSTQAQTAAGTLGVSPIDALDYLSFNGFRLTPAIIDGLYNVLTEKGGAVTAESGGAYAYGGTSLSNEECDKRLKTGKAYQDVIKILQPTTTGGGSTATSTDLGREIRSLFYFSQRLSMGKIMDGCEQAMKNVQSSQIRPGIDADGMSKILEVCTGNKSDFSAFGKIRGDNLASLNMFIDKMFQSIGQNSGSSGSGIAQAFKGDKSLAATGDLK